MSTVGNILTFNGISWSAPVALDPGVAMNRVSCPSRTFCAAGDADGNVYFYNAGVV